MVSGQNKKTVALSQGSKANISSQGERCMLYFLPVCAPLHFWQLRTLDEQLHTLDERGVMTSRPFGKAARSAHAQPASLCLPVDLQVAQ